MKLNIAYPATGCQKLIEIDDEKKLRAFYEKRLSAEVPGDSLGDEWKGYILRITGGNDKQGFPMKQGILTTGRVRLLLGKGQSCYRPRRDGERKRKSIRGCIVDANLSVLSMIIVRKGEQEIEGLTDKTIPRRLGPKRASKIRKLFNLSKEDDVHKYVVRKPLPPKEGVAKPRTHAPKIQRLMTPAKLHRRRRLMAARRQRKQKRQDEASAYTQLLAKRVKEARQAKLAKRRRKTSSTSRSRTSKRESDTKSEEVEAPAPKKVVKSAKRPAPAPEIALKALKDEAPPPAKAKKSAKQPAPAKAPPAKEVPAKKAAPAAKEAKKGAKPAAAPPPKAAPAKKKKGGK